MDLDVVLAHGAGTDPLRDQLEARCAPASATAACGRAPRLPPSRALARELGVSRGVVVEAYAQLAAEGFLVARRGAGTRVAAAAAARGRAARRGGASTPPSRDAGRATTCAPAVPDLAAFPRARVAGGARARRCATLPDAGLGYGDPRGAPALRAALASYLGAHARRRRRPARSRRLHGLSRRGSALVWRALRRARRAARRASRTRAGAASRRTSRTPACEAGAGPGRRATGSTSTRSPRRRATPCVVTPAHQFPTGVVLAPERRAALRRLGARARRADRRGRLRRRVPLRPRAGRRAAGARARPRRLRRLGEQDARARRCASAGWSLPPQLVARPSPTEKRPRRPRRAGARPARARRPDRAAASSTATCAARAAATAPAATRSSPRSPSDLPDGARRRRRRRPARRRVGCPTASTRRAVARAPRATRGVRGRRAARATAPRSPRGPPALLLGYAALPEDPRRAGARVASSAPAPRALAQREELVHGRVLATCSAREPGPARGRDAPADERELRDAVRVGVDEDRDAGLGRVPRVDVVEVAAVGRRVDLEHRAGARRRLDDLRRCRPRTAGGARSCGRSGGRSRRCTGARTRRRSAWSSRPRGIRNAVWTEPTTQSSSASRSSS